MHPAYFVLLVALVDKSSFATIVNSVAPSAISCDRVVLGSQSADKWAVSCITESTVASSASFNPVSVKSFYVNNETSVLASSSNFELSSSFSEIDKLVSSSVTSFSLLAASGFQPDTPVSIVSTAFAQLSALQHLHIEGIPLADSGIHLVLPASIQKIDFRQNNFDQIPPFVFDLPEGLSTIDLRSNAIQIPTAISAHTKQLKVWLNDDILRVDTDMLEALNSLTQQKRGSIVGTSKPMESMAATTKHLGPALPTHEDEIKTIKKEDVMSGEPIAIIVIVIPAMLAVGVTLAFVLWKRRRALVHNSTGILNLPYPFGKSFRERSESSGHFTAIAGEHSQSQMSCEEGIQDTYQRDSCFIIAMPTNSEQSYKTTSSIVSSSYVDLESPQERRQTKSEDSIYVLTYERGDSDHSLELLGTHSSASITETHARTPSRNALRSALTSLITIDPDEAAPLLTVNAYDYILDSNTQVEESAFAFFVGCRLRNRSTEDAAPGSIPLQKLLLKFFIEEDADLAGRESYALRILENDKLSRTFAPRLFDDALGYELKVGCSQDTVNLSCCILVLEKTDCITLQAHMVLSLEPQQQYISRVVKALRALHSRRLVHGALDTDSFIVCSTDGFLKLWGLEYATRVGHKNLPLDMNLLKKSQAECMGPEIATFALKDTESSRATLSLDIWSLGVIILKIYASGRQLDEFQDCMSPHDVLDRLSTWYISDDSSNCCFFERSIVQFAPNKNIGDLLRQCFHRVAASRPSIDFILSHTFFQAKEREVSRATTVRSAVTSRMLSATVDESGISSLREPKSMLLPSMILKRKNNMKDIVSKKKQIKAVDDVTPEPLPPSLWLFLPPVELQVDLTKGSSFFSIEQWVVKLKRLQQQRAVELRFPLVFMCESCESGAAIPCSVATVTNVGVSVSSSLLSLVMPLVRETMLFLEARAILSNGLTVGEVSGLTGPQQWKELRTFYRALECMELATVNPVNEIELAPMELQLKSRDPSKAEKVLEKLTDENFSEDKREYVRNLLDAIVVNEDFVSGAERSSWAALRRCDIFFKNSSELSQTRWLCSHHAFHKR
ncbi:hypothetical protein CCR75_002673 [Bremia lactucae]|uniref:Protein kinase domain-containing protein n=1 Tax=Bremia lactucae TaxID=4779 RepID=A0A976IHH5_BRELC|nr:hypothetical protein CCR75_002673 [Bremia lactucae]